MNITSQICSIELATKLKELGIKQDSLFYRFGTPDLQYIFCKEYEQYSPQVNLNIKNGYAAFTAEELTKFLPERIIKEEIIVINGEKHLINYDYHLKISYFEESTGHYHCSYIGYPILQGFTLSNLGSSSFGEHDEKMSDAIAKMLIYLLENNLMEFKNE